MTKMCLWYLHTYYSNSRVIHSNNIRIKKTYIENYFIIKIVWNSLKKMYCCKNLLTIPMQANTVGISLLQKKSNLCGISLITWSKLFKISRKSEYERYFVFLPVSILSQSSIDITEFTQNEEMIFGENNYYVEYSSVRTM